MAEQTSISAQQTSISNICEAEQNVVFECVFEYISDIRALISLSQVSKGVRGAIYRSNGLRQLTYKDEESNWKLNLVLIKGENREEKLKDGVHWIWNIGKRLKTICLVRYSESWHFCVVVFPLLVSLTTSEKRRIETIKIGAMPYDWALGLVRENCNSLRRLCVELWDQHFFEALFPLLPRCSLSELTESASFWPVVQQCERLESLDLKLCDRNKSPIIPLDLVYFLRHASLKHLGLSCKPWVAASKTKHLYEFLNLLSVESLRHNLESLKLDSTISFSLFCPFVQKLACSHTPVVFINVTEITFEFLRACCRPDLINWLAFYTVFPAMKEIKSSLLGYAYLFNSDSCFSHNFSNFCKTYLEVSVSRSCRIKIEIPVAHHGSTDPQRMIASVARAATLPEDQDWCVSHGVHIETEMRDNKVEKVTLRKDTATLVFHFKFMD